MKSFNRTALVVIALFAAVAWLLGGLVSLFSVLLGGAFALLNAKWMMSGIDAVLTGDGRDRTAAVAARFIGRLVLIFGVLFAIIHTSFLSVPGVVAGLATGVTAAVLEEFRNIVWRK